MMGLRGRLERIERRLPPGRGPLAALAWQGSVRKLLIAGLVEAAPAGMKVDDLPERCHVFELDPAEATGLLYFSTDGKPQCKIVYVPEDTC